MPSLTSTYVIVGVASNVLILSIRGRTLCISMRPYWGLDVLLSSHKVPKLVCPTTEDDRAVRL